MKFRPLHSTLLLLTLLLAFGGCATKPAGFPHAKSGPTASSTKTPSECLSRGKAAEDRNEWAAAYSWYARGGGWNDRGRSSGFPSPGELAEPEDTQRFLCIVGFLDATRRLIAQGVRVDIDGVHPLYISVSEATQTISYYRNSHPHGYAGFTDAQIAALQQNSIAMPGLEPTVAARPVSREGTMDMLEQVDHTPSHLKTFQETVSSSSTRASADKYASAPIRKPAIAPRETVNFRDVPPIAVPADPNKAHLEAARLYRQAAAKYPEGDARREEMLKLAAEEEREANQR